MLGRFQRLSPVTEHPIRIDRPPKAQPQTWAVQWVDPVAAFDLAAFDIRAKDLCWQPTSTPRLTPIAAGVPSGAIIAVSPAAVFQNLTSI